jgi:hypothetical protein
VKELASSILKTSLRGELIQPSDERYEAVRKVYNGMIDRHPALIARCADVADVIAAVNFAREHNLLVSIRGGGHNASGLGVCDDGLAIDLSRIRYTHVDPETRTVRIGGGSTWADVDHSTHVFGLAVPGGMISTTGVGGLTLGGGLGHLTRKYSIYTNPLIVSPKGPPPSGTRTILWSPTRELPPNFRALAPVPTEIVTTFRLVSFFMTQDDAKSGCHEACAMLWRQNVLPPSFQQPSKR